MAIVTHPIPDGELRRFLVLSERLALAEQQGQGSLHEARERVERIVRPHLVALLTELTEHREQAAKARLSEPPAWLRDLQLYNKSWRETRHILTTAKRRQRLMVLNAGDAEKGLEWALTRALEQLPGLLGVSLLPVAPSPSLPSPA